MLSKYLHLTRETDKVRQISDMKVEHSGTCCVEITLNRFHKYLIIRLVRDSSSNTFDDLDLSVDRLSVEVRGEGDPLQVGEMIVLHQPGYSLYICQGEESEARPGSGGCISHLLG